MYFFEKEKRDEFLQGRTITYIANIVGITRQFLTSILNGKRHCSKPIAYAIVKAGNCEKEIEDYFEARK